MKALILSLALLFGFGSLAVVPVTNADVSVRLELPFFVPDRHSPRGEWRGGRYHGRHYPKGHYYPKKQWKKHGYNDNRNDNHDRHGR